MDLKIVREEMLNYGAKVGLKVEEETSEKLVVHSELPPCPQPLRTRHLRGDYGILSNHLTKRGWVDCRLEQSLNGKTHEVPEGDWQKEVVGICEGQEAVRRKGPELFRGR